MTGNEALEALKNGKSVRCVLWTPGNKLVPKFYDETGTMDIETHGSEIFLHDCTLFPGWLVASLITDTWEICA